MNEADIIIEIREEFREHKGNIFVLTYADVDTKRSLPEGSTKQHIEQAIEGTRIEIVTKGEKRVELRRNPVRLVRG
jgi:hypothetical protein